MKNFFQLNKQKLKTAFQMCSLVFLTIVILILGVGYINGAQIDLKTTVIVVFIATVFFPVFIFFLAIIDWKMKTNKRIRAFSYVPFDQLESIEFVSSYKNENSKFYFTEEIKSSFINDYHIVCDLNIYKPEIIEFKALTKNRNLSKNELNNLMASFEKQDIRFEFDGLIKQYNLKSMKFEEIDQLKSDLIDFTETLKENNFEPLENKDQA